MPAPGWMSGPGTIMAVLNRNPLSGNKGNAVVQRIVFLYELKHDLNLYLKDWATHTDIKTIADIVAFNEAHADKALRFGHDLFLAANSTRGDLSEREYKSARAMDLLTARTRGMDAYMNQHKLDAVLFPGATGAAIAARAGYPSVAVPGGFVSGADGKDTPDYPLGVTFAGRAWSEHKLLRLAYAYEQASNMRKPPPGLPALEVQLHRVRPKGLSAVRQPPPEDRNDEARREAHGLVAHFHPVGDRRGVPLDHLARPVQQPVHKIGTESPDFPLRIAVPQHAAAIDAQIDLDDASNDLTQEEPHAWTRFISVAHRSAGCTMMLWYDLVWCGWICGWFNRRGVPRR
jgi:hypothetical protein